MNALVFETGEPFGVPGVQIPLSVLYMMPLLPNGKASAPKADKPKGCARFKRNTDVSLSCRRRLCRVTLIGKRLSWKGSVAVRQ